MIEAIRTQYGVTRGEPRNRRTEVRVAYIYLCTDCAKTYTKLEEAEKHKCKKGVEDGPGKTSV
jgi:hypothetical protein